MVSQNHTHIYPAGVAPSGSCHRNYRHFQSNCSASGDIKGNHADACTTKPTVLEHRYHITHLDDTIRIHSFWAPMISISWASKRWSLLKLGGKQQGPWRRTVCHVDRRAANGSLWRPRRYCIFSGPQIRDSLPQDDTLRERVTQPLQVSASDLHLSEYKPTPRCKIRGGQTN